MKNLKYIKLFEAFESEKLSKTLAYVKDKNDFLSKVKRICDLYDFPYSKLNDELFDYLPFSKALKKSDAIDDENCKATSLGEFGESGIAEQNCESGKIKRKWGSQERVVSCTRCLGTGVEPKKPGDVKIVKFWFTKEGELVALTGVDGLVRNQSEEMSDDLNDYTIGDSIAKTKFKSLPNGTIVKLDYNYWRASENDLICYILKDNNTLYGIQNRVSGNSPWRYSNWNKIAKYSTELRKDSISNIKMLLPKKINNDPYSFNAGLEISSYSVSINNRTDVRDAVKNAHFSIILDLVKLRESNYKTVDKIKSERSDLKKDAVSLLSNDEIRNTNIKRYLDKISKDINITDDIKNISKFVKRLLGFRSALYLLLVDSNVKDSLNSVISYYYNLLSNPSDASINNVNYYTKRALEQSGNTLNRVNNNLREIKNELSGKDYSKQLELLKSLDEISLLLYNKISNLELETIEDLEVAYQKLQSVRNIFTSNRYKISYSSNFIEYLDSSSYKRALNTLIEHWRIIDNIDEMLSEVDRIKKIINKL